MTSPAHTITVQTSVKSDLDKVWACWTLPEHIINWNFASDDWCCPHAENDLKPNGRFSWRMEAKDGSMGFDFDGTYDQIIDKELISSTLGDGRSVSISFAANGDVVTVTETFETEDLNSAELQRAGWQAILDNFKLYVESKAD
jgi:uncharacterized protein YndB with AHSA1/START domain